MEIGNTQPPRYLIFSQIFSVYCKIFIKFFTIFQIEFISAEYRIVLLALLRLPLIAIAGFGVLLFHVNFNDWKLSGFASMLLCLATFLSFLLHYFSVNKYDNEFFDHFVVLKISSDSTEKFKNLQRNI